MPFWFYRLWFHADLWTLSWLFAETGLWGPLLLVSAVVSFTIALRLVARGRGPAAVAALLLTVHVPFLVGILGAIDNSITAIKSSTQYRNPRAEIAGGISLALYLPLTGLFLMVPGYTTAFIGSLVRALREADEAQPGPRSSHDRTALEPR